MPERNEKRKSKANAARRRKEIPPVDSAWLRDRFRERGLTQADLARALGIRAPSVSEILSGQRAVQIGEAIALAKSLDVAPDELFRRLGYAWPQRRCQVVGEVDRDGRVHDLLPERAREVYAPEEPVKLVALVLQSDNLDWGVLHGTHVYFEPTGRVQYTAMGKLSVVGSSESERLLGIPRPASGDRVRIAVFGSHEIVEAPKLVSADRVRWIKCG